jgi:hypothetical protein
MRPAEGGPDLPGWPVLQQALEAAVAVHLQHPPEFGQVGRRALAAQRRFEALIRAAGNTPPLRMKDIPRKRPKAR